MNKKYGAIQNLHSFAAYQELIISPAQIALCRDMTSVATLLACIKQLWQQTELSDEQLIAQLHLCNQQVLAVSGDRLAQCWIPYKYNAKSRNLFWCLPDGRATEPFHDEFISRCRQQVLVNQLLAPKTLIASETLPEFSTAVFQPAGFIFHLSRCGSTLVSGSFAEVERASVLSESQLLTEVLLDSNLTNSEKQQWLPHLIRWQGDKTGQQKVVIKWNAWDIFYWPIIRSLYPQTPVILLIRNPEEILASHQRKAGRHMSGDPSMAHVHPVFDRKQADISMLDFRINVLNELLNTMGSISSEPGVMVVDYQELTPSAIQRIGEHFGVMPEIAESNRIQQRMQRHSKEPERQFQPDSLQKQQLFNAQEQEKIHRSLLATYQQLLVATLGNA